MDIDRLARRPGEYLASTGMPQLVAGLTFSLLGAAALIQMLLVRTHHLDLSLVAQWTGIASAALVAWRLSLIRKNLVYPRGGYVQPLDTRNRYLYAATGFLFVLAIGVWATVRSSGPPLAFFLDNRLVWPGFAIVFALICLVGAGKTKDTLTLGFGIYLAFLAPVLYLIPLDNYSRSAAFQMAAGLPLAISGAVRLKRYLRTNPIQTDATNE